MANTAPSAREKALRKAIGQRLRWIREAYEERWPLQHGLEQWAKALGISAPKLSRIENGQQFPTLELLDRIAWTTGATMDFVFWRVAAPPMVDWLEKALRRAHPDDVVGVQGFLIDRDRTLGKDFLHRTPDQQRQRQRRRSVELEL